MFRYGALVLCVKTNLVLGEGRGEAKKRISSGAEV